MSAKRKTSEEILSSLLTNAIRQENGCLISHLKPNAKGYIYIQVGGREGVKWRANRFIWTMLKGPIPEYMQVCHECDIRNCIEVEHFFLGTGLDNTSDMIKKNRVARLGRPEIPFFVLEEAFKLKLSGFSLADIASIQGLSSPSAASDRIRRYYDVRAKNVII